jgi:ABC-type Fe3+-hydroxamate transport system substrate-binding protein
LRAVRVFAVALAALAGSALASREFTDDAGREVQLPDRVERVYAAGPLASVLVLAIAPDKVDILYPSAFHHDLKREVAQFYKLFYQPEPTPAQVDSLLSEPGVAPR